MRTFATYSNPNVKGLLQRLTDRVPPPEYRQTMLELGNELAEVVAGALAPGSSILLICTNEDADFLARGVLETLQARGFGNIALACFWNERRQVTSGVAPTLDSASIIRRYVEPVGEVDAFVVVKSAISGACVVRTNITELVYDKHPKRIFVVAPVMYSEARAGLEAEFEPAIAQVFEYVWFAQDDELLGVGNKDTKNQYTPNLVRQRRAALSTSS